MAFSIATFNVKDLLGAGDAPGARQALDAKLDWLAEMIARVDADVLGLQEVGPLAVLGELCDRVASRGARADYRERIVGTADDRGIRNALVSRVPVITSAIHAPSRLDFPVFQAGDPPPFGDRVPMRRGIVHAAVDGGALGQVDVLVAHLKSKRRLFLRDAAGERLRSEVLSGRELAEAELRSLVWRCSEALFVRGLVDALLGSDPGARIAVVGDLNDQPGSLVPRIVAGTGTDELCSAADLVPEERRFSILHRGRRDLLDHVLLTRNLYALATGAHLYNEALRDHGEIGLAALPPLPPPAPPPPEPPATPDSDHAPLVVRFG
jgi:endonuclease/exonuclease/phosphatase family metal-dependent hydrolase